MRSFFLFCSGLFLPLSTWAASVKAPEGFKLAVPAFAAGTSSTKPECLKPIPYTGEMKFTDKYEKTASKDQMNAEAEARYKEEVKPITDLEKAVGTGVDNYLKLGDPAYLDCAIGNLKEWSRQDAISRPAGNSIGVMVRSWALSTIASAYLRLKLSASKPLASKLNSQDRLMIEKWMQKLGSRVIKERPVNAPKINNHYYWSAQAVVTLAAILQKSDYLTYGSDMFEIFSRQVDASGFLPNELERRTRALSYHNYSLQALSVVAAFLEANALVSTNERDALKRLVVVTRDGRANPKIFEDAARNYAGGSATDNFTQESPGGNYWVAPYCFAEPADCSSISMKASKKPAIDIRMGGDMTLLYGGL